MPSCSTCARNGGGSLTEAINLTGLFINDGPVVQVKDADGRVTPYHDLDPGIAWSGPLVVVISKFSAQRQRDSRRGYPGLWPWSDRRRPFHAWQGKPSRASLTSVSSCSGSRTRRRWAS